MKLIKYYIAILILTISQYLRVINLFYLCYKLYNNFNLIFLYNICVKMQEANKNLFFQEYVYCYFTYVFLEIFLREK